MELEKIVPTLHRRLSKQAGFYPQISKCHRDLDYSWLQKFSNRTIRNPTIKKLIILEKALDKWEKKREGDEKAAA